MSDLATFRYLWDGSAPEWVIAELQGHWRLPLNTQTGELLSILDGEPLLIERVVQRMQREGRPLLDYVDWDVQHTTSEKVLDSIETISQRVWRIRTRTTRALGEQALQITAPLKEIRTRLGASEDRKELLEAARKVWSVHLELLELEREHRM